MHKIIEKKYTKYKIFTKSFVFISCIFLNSLVFLNEGMASNNIEPKNCIFPSALNTRNDPSKITMNSGSKSYLEHTTQCTLETSYVYKDNYGHGLVCNGGFADATGTYADSLDINYNFTLKSSVAETKPGGGNSHTVTKENEALTSNQYNNIKQDWHHYDFIWRPDNPIGVNKFDTIMNNVTIENISGKNLKIGQFITANYDSTALKLTGVPKNIQIYKLKAGGSNLFSVNTIDTTSTPGFEAQESIDINTLELTSSQNINLTLKAPLIVIREMNLNNNNNHIILYADEIDIDEIDFGEHNTLVVHPYTPGKKVKFYNRQTVLSSTSKMIWDSGDYYIKDIDIPGSGQGISFVNASGANQVINLFIDSESQNHDFEIGNNFGINSAGTNGNYGNNPPEHFRIFVNGDLVTGGGGTTFNALIYVEGEVDFGSPTYLKGALSSGNDIWIGNNSHFFFDTGKEGWGECIKYSNRYSCGIFDNILTTYDSLHVGGSESPTNVQICKENAVSYPKNAFISENASSLSCNSIGCGSGRCIRNDPPVNRLVYRIFRSNRLGHLETSISGTLQAIEYGDIHGDFDLTLNPAHTYPNHTTPLMLLGDVTLTGVGNRLAFKPGDYYFHSLTFANKNQKISLPSGGPVRIFIATDLNVTNDGLNINSAGNADNLFIYVAGNADFSTKGKIHVMKAYLYTKGSVSFNTDSTEFEVHGGVAAEGPIYIRGNHPVFIHDSNASKLGYGECQICYADIKMNGININFFNCGGFSMVKDIKVPVYTDTTLHNVTVDEAHRQDLFSFSFMDNYDVLDQDNHKIADATIHSQGWSAGAMGMDVTLFGDKAVSYPLGYTYGPADKNKGYYQLHSSSLFDIGFNPCNWIKSLAYVAHYDDDEGRHYDIQLSKCMIKSSQPKLYVAGPFDGWDVFRNITDRNISTKIIDNKFTLTIASINRDNNGTEEKPGIDIRFSLFDDNTNTMIEPNWHDFNASIVDKIEMDFNVTRAVQNARIKFAVCSDFNTTAHTYELFAFNRCNSDCPSFTYDGIQEPCIRYFSSSDNFAVRPHRFDTNLTSGKYIAERNISIAFKALNADALPSTDYNETQDGSVVIDINLSNPALNCNRLNNTLVPNIIFTNGKIYGNYRFKYIGDYNLTIREKSECDQKFAAVDCDDATVQDSNGHLIWSVDKNLSITPFVLNNISIKPARFIISNVKYIDADSEKGYTYLSNLNDDRRMFATLQFDLSAGKENNETAENYVNGCYAKDFNISFNFSKSKNNNLVLQMFDDIDNTISEGENREFSTSYFLKSKGGKAAIKLYINFDRNASKPIEKFEHNITNIEVKDEEDLHGNSSPHVGGVHYYYVRLHAPNYQTYTNSIETPIYVEIYNTTNPGNDWNESIDDINWWIHPDHNISDGNITALTPKIGFSDQTDSTIQTDVNNTLSNGVFPYSKITYTGTQKPHKTQIRISTQPWLKYHRFISDPNTMLYYDVDFLGGGGWAGVGQKGQTLPDINGTNERIEW